MVEDRRLAGGRSAAQYCERQALQLAEGFVEISQRLQQHVVGACVEALPDSVGDGGLITPGHDSVYQPVAATAGGRRRCSRDASGC
jgi:hypothetical protein